MIVITENMKTHKMEPKEVSKEEYDERVKLVGAEISTYKSLDEAQLYCDAINKTEGR